MTVAPAALANRTRRAKWPLGQSSIPGRWVKASADMTTYSAARPSAPSDVLVAERFFGRHGLLEVVAGNSVDRKSILLAGHDDALQIAAALDDIQPHPVGCSGVRIDAECDDRGLDGAPHGVCGLVIGHALHRRVMSVDGDDHPALEFFGRDVYAHSPAPHVSLRLSISSSTSTAALANAKMKSSDGSASFIAKEVVGKLAIAEVRIMREQLRGKIAVAGRFEKLPQHQQIPVFGLIRREGDAGLVALLLLLLHAGWIDARGFFDRGHGLPLALLCEAVGHADANGASIPAASILAPAASDRSYGLARCLTSRRAA